ncbi:hypothetical protein ABC977_09815 [Thioalkalicoccus limnaeus]|uniref:Type II secretion system protein GspC N-terminal domain-containing protein n=1 Tax=Thioalkalicoccus limnaeus TaxID=120681 RepID=A0ABV4BJV3_9GAMM
MKGIWTLILVGLIAILWAQWHDWPMSPDPLPPADDAAPQVADVLTPTADLLARLDRLDDRLAYAEVTERPLFHPERRPVRTEASDEAEIPVAEATELAGLDLTAIIMTPELTVAWVQSRQSPQALIRVRPGDDLLGWVVREIRADHLLLEGHGRTDRLPLRDYSAATPAPASVLRNRGPQAERRPPRPSHVAGSPPAAPIQPSRPTGP